MVSTLKIQFYRNQNELSMAKLKLINPKRKKKNTHSIIKPISHTITSFFSHPPTSKAHPTFTYRDAHIQKPSSIIFSKPNKLCYTASPQYLSRVTRDSIFDRLSPPLDRLFFLVGVQAVGGNTGIETPGKDDVDPHHLGGSEADVFVY